MFGVKKVKLDSSITIWIKKLDLIDFMGCDYVPLVFSYVESDRTHRIKKEEFEDKKQEIKKILQRSIVKIKSKRIDLKDFIDYCVLNDSVLELVYTYIYTMTFKKKIVKQFV